MTPRSRARWLVACLALAAFVAAPPALAQVETSAPPVLTAPSAPAVVGAPPSTWPAPAAEAVTASSWVLVEAATGQRLAEHAADDPRPVASTVKILTALTAVARVDLDQTVTVGDEVLVGGASVGLEPGETWTVRELLEATLVRSGNDATEALATHVAGDTEAFVSLMREDAAALGIEGGELGSPSGLGDENLLTALDLAVLARAALEQPALRPFFTLEEVTLPGAEPVESRNLLLRTYPGATGLKTGFTTAAGNSLVASAERNGRELIAVVLDAGDDPARFEQAAELLDLGFDGYVGHTLGTRLELAVAGGWQAFSAPEIVLTAPLAHEPSIEVAVPQRVPEGALDGRVTVAGDEVATTTLVPDQAGGAASAAGSAGRLGAALVDGVYASLRAANSAGALR
ncbi:MAG: D-alanyl-D-alanine carboxypeptidase [Actinobacteria bacterium]|nr:D-alanyl-D-alanine carboxypeptidase [Actinomycetota bacterium]